MSNTEEYRAKHAWNDNLLVYGYYVVIESRHKIFENARVSKHSGSYADIHEDTLSKFTGKQDKNRKDIFGSVNQKNNDGGDFVKIKGEIGKVVWHETLLQWIVDFIPYSSDTVPLWEFDEEDIEILGTQFSKEFKTLEEQSTKEFFENENKRREI